jgi:hypothetical protein
MRVRIHDMGGSDTRLCRVDIEDATAGQYTIRVFAIHAQGVFDQSYSFNGTTYSTAPFFLPAKSTSGRVATSISIEVHVARLVNGLATDAHRFEMSYFLQPVEVRVEVPVPTPLPPGAFVPQYRTGQYLIRDFTKLNGIEQSIGGTYRTWDIDFIQVQTLSMAQAAQKCRDIAASSDPNLTLQYRLRSLPHEEWTARRDPTLNAALGEIARVIDFSVAEIQNKQKFSLANPHLLRVLP